MLSITQISNRQNVNRNKTNSVVNKTNFVSRDSVSFGFKINQIDAKNQALIRRLEQIWILERANAIENIAKRFSDPAKVLRLSKRANPRLVVPDFNSDYRYCKIHQIGTASSPIFAIKDGDPWISRTSITVSSGSDQANLVEESYRRPFIPFLGGLRFRQDKEIRSSSPSNYYNLNQKLAAYLEPTVEHYSGKFAAQLKQLSIDKEWRKIEQWDAVC